MLFLSMRPLNQLIQRISREKSNGALTNKNKYATSFCRRQIVFTRSLNVNLISEDNCGPSSRIAIRQHYPSMHFTDGAAEATIVSNQWS